MTDIITLRRAAEQARSALNGWANHGRWAWPESALQTCKQNTEEALAALDAALAEQKPVEYRCHADIDDLSGPDGCVLDSGNPDDCMYARRFGKNAREHCNFWKPFVEEVKP